MRNLVCHRSMSGKTCLRLVEMLCLSVTMTGSVCQMLLYIQWCDRLKLVTTGYYLESISKIVLWTLFLMTFLSWPTRLDRHLFLVPLLLYVYTFVYSITRNSNSLRNKRSIYLSFISKFEYVARTHRFDVNTLL